MYFENVGVDDEHGEMIGYETAREAIIEAIKLRRLLRGLLGG